MRIALILLPPFVLPFIILGASRALWFVAGAEWSKLEMAAMMSLIIGGVVGGAASFSAFADPETKGKS